MDDQKRRKLRKLLLLALAVMLVDICAGIKLYRTIDRARAVEGKLTVHFIDVGQGDAALLTFPDGTTAMIDTGTEESVPVVEAYLKRWDVESIEYIFLSHLHSDHAGGLDALCESFEVGTVCYAGDPPILAEREENRPAFMPLSAGDDLEIGGVSVTVLAPIGEMKEENDNSMVLRIDYGERSLLFTGDSEKAAEEALLAASLAELDVDVLKVAHHGSSNSSSDAFVDAVSPQVAVISASEDNTFGHPAPSVVERMTEAGAVVFVTHESGSVTLVCDGKTIVRRSGDDYLAVPNRRVRAVCKAENNLNKFMKFQKNACNFLSNTV